MLAATKRLSRLNVLSQQAYFCRDKRRVCRDKTYLLSLRQNYVSILLSRHVFVATKIILMAAPANDTFQPGKCACVGMGVGV